MIIDRLESLISEVLCSVQRALLDNITPNLRAVSVEFLGKRITLNFYYDFLPSEEELELASLADTEFISDFPAPDYETGCEIVTLPFPKKIEGLGYFVYRRNEK